MTELSPRTDPPPTRPDGRNSAESAHVGWALSQMAGLMLSRETVETALELVTSLAVAATAGMLGSAVTVVDEHGKRSRAASNQAAEQADALQYEFDEGPCLTAWQTGWPVRVDDTRTDAHWPRWSEAAARLGVGSVLSAPLVVGEESTGAMKVYCGRPDNDGRHDEQVMRLLAAQAAILLASSQSLQEARRLSRQLTEALGSRDAIARATGILLARGAAGQEEAFAELAATARATDRTVENVARALLDAVIGRNSGSSLP